ncbi:hypothetical protein OQA88_8699 [Cercophora sp. LCS_1]
MASPDGPGLADLVGHQIPDTYTPGVVVLSYVVSLIGSASTLELINRRTSRKGIYNYLLLLGAAITMGGVAIWCMHFIGNRATVLLNGEPGAQIAYSPGVTVASLFVPICVLFIAFYVVTLSNRINWWRIGVSGTLSGAAICGMHYLGNAAISNYTCVYTPGSIAGAVVIAAVASTVALALFFVFRTAWTHSWWKRIGCAIVLASAVSGMHWCAALGTSWIMKKADHARDDDMRNTTLIAVSCLSIGACFVMAFIAVSAARARKGYASKAQSIAVAAVVFDRQGRIMVTPDGLLPTEETQGDLFTTAHPLFQWAFQATRNWTAVSEIINKISSHLAGLPHHNRNIRTGVDLVDHDGHIINNYDTVFCELFCLAASALAGRMREPLVNAGTLWDEMFSTGGAPLRASMDDDGSARSGSTEALSKQGMEDLAEKGIAYRTKQDHGSLMMLVRQLDDNREVDKLEAAGFRFAELRQVAQIIGSTMQIRHKKFEERLRAMGQRTQEVMLDPGVHVGVFAIRPRTDAYGYDVVVKENSHNLLPNAWVPLDRLDTSHTRFLRLFEGQSMSAIWQYLSCPQELPNQDARIATVFKDAIQDLRASLNDSVFDDAKFSAKAVQVPCSSPPDGKPLKCTFLTFSVVLPTNCPLKCPKYRFVPLSLLRTQQLLYDTASHSAAFARSIHRDILPVLNSEVEPSEAPISSSHRKNFVPLVDSHGRSPFNRLTKSRGSTGSIKPLSSRDRTMASSNASMSSIKLYNMKSAETGTYSRDEMKGSVPMESLTPVKQQGTGTFGGIMISSEVTVDVEEVTEAPSPANQKPLGRQKSMHGLNEQDIGDSAIDGHNVGGQGGDDVLTAPYEQQTATRPDVSAAIFGMGNSKVVVTKEHEVTFVDDLLARCIDTPRRA